MFDSKQQLYSSYGFAENNRMHQQTEHTAFNFLVIQEMA